MTWKPDDLFWARYAAGELSFFERWRFQRRLAQSEELQQELRAFEEQRAAFDQDPARQEEIIAITAAVRGVEVPVSSRHNKRLWLALPTAALVAGIVAVTLLPPPDTFTPKGDVFVLYQQHDGEVAPLGPLCHPEDALRAQYKTSKPYLLVVGQDASGVVQALFPLNGEASRALDAPAGITPGSWVLDERLGVERFIALFSEEPIQTAQVERALVSTGTVSLPGVTIVEQRCRKVSP